MEVSSRHDNVGTLRERWAAAAIRQALLDRKVLVFRGQRLNPSAHRAFAASTVTP